MRISKTLLLCGLLAGCFRLAAQPGTLDPAFGRAGRTLTNIFHAQDQAFGALRRPDGRLLIVGSSQYDSSNVFAALQLLPDGTTDPSFDRDGKLIQSLGNGEEIAYAVAQYPDGRAIIAGIESYSSANNDFALLRITADGQPDPSFGNKGKVLTDFSGGNESVHAVLLQSDGKIIVCGSTAPQPDGEANLAMARYLPDGQPDSSFGVQGKMEISLSINSDIAYDAVLQPDGKILIAGELSYDEFSYDFLVARFMPDGSLDESFGANGFSTVDFNAPFDLCRGIALLPDGHIVLAGFSSFDDFISRVTICRLDPAGHLDPDFGNGGRVVQEIGLFGAFTTDVQVQSDGKILVSGMAFDADYRDFFILRLQENGALDSSFGTAGAVVTSVSDRDDNSYALVLEPGGGMSLVGKSQGDTETDVVVLRYLSTGALDPTYGNNGIVRIDLGNSEDLVTDMLRQPDGHILVCGYTYDNPIAVGKVSAVLASYRSDGILDSQFANTGINLTTITPKENYWKALAHTGDGKILAAGKTGNQPVLAQYKPDGTLDPGFADQGKLILPEGPSDGLETVLVQPDGKIVVAGDQGPDHDPLRNLFLRLYPDGTLDSTFGNNGAAVDVLPQGRQIWRKIQLLPNGNFLAIGAWQSFNGNLIDGNFIACYRPNGTLDSSFAQNGFLLFNNPDSLPLVQLYGFDRMPNGKILLCGKVNSLDAVLRLNQDGSLDSGFGTNGLGLYDSGQLNNRLEDIHILADGQIVAIGRSSNVYDYKIIILRLKPDGTLDEMFGDQGIFRYPASIGKRLEVLPDQSILVAGSFFSEELRSDILLLHLLNSPALGVADQPSASPTLLVYPNPVAESLQLEYELTQDQRVTIQLFDASGKQAGLLIDSKYRDAGPQKEQLFFPKNLPSGIYTLVLKTGSGTRKAVQILKK